MKFTVTKSKLYGFAVGAAVLGLLAMPIVGPYGLKSGSVSVASIDDETDWTLANKDGTSEEEADWTLTKNKAGDDETDWTLASNNRSHEEEVDWTLA
ncbi:hypothetical protein [Candidatus Nitrospira allomarina]|jgi:hypothetical protein|uniref:Uncharacterized protein n=1 Tax=Candidatus Nitrospira allomarina TaxID=3020900 RepID=A0AA96JSF9_9BACT|nr:hypothetical protein [Candidatus Nitrospira allomarina]WNM58035.1 hypothetical protein PP769_19015 [Candidatus Nitrospira allomarina]